MRKGAQGRANVFFRIGKELSPMLPWGLGLGNRNDFFVTRKKDCGFEAHPDGSRIEAKVPAKEDPPVLWDDKHIEKGKRTKDNGFRRSNSCLPIDKGFLRG